MEFVTATEKGLARRGLLSSGCHAARSISALAHALDDPLLSGLMSEPCAAGRFVDFLDTAFADPVPVDVLPLPLIRVVVAHVRGDERPVDPNQLQLDLVA